MTLNFLDVGFVWTEKSSSGGAPTDPADPVTMMFGFGGDSMNGYSSDGGYAQKGSSFRFTFWELSSTPGVVLESATIESVKAPSSKHTHSAPFDGFPLTVTFNSQGKVGRSGPLNTQAPSWGTPGAYSIQYEGAFLITVTMKAILNGETHYYRVDPELVVGTKSKGTGEL